MGIPPTGRHIAAITGITIHRFADGKLVESWASYDMMGFMQQLTAEEWLAQGGNGWRKESGLRPYRPHWVT
jgi:hypothetical protein